RASCWGSPTDAGRSTGAGSRHGAAAHGAGTIPQVALAHASYCVPQLIATQVPQAVPCPAHCVLQLDWMQPSAVTSGDVAFGQDAAKHCWMHWLKSRFGWPEPVGTPASPGGQRPRQVSVSAHDTVPVP